MGRSLLLMSIPLHSERTQIEKVMGCVFSHSESIYTAELLSHAVGEIDLAAWTGAMADETCISSNNCRKTHHMFTNKNPF